MNFGELKAVRLLGRGGMSEVWEAENARLGSRHAVKVYAYPKDDAEVRTRFVQEGHMLAKLSHPRIVRVADIGQLEDGRPYFAMDLVLNPEGQPQTLAAVPAGSADEETVARWYDDLREALAYIHGKGIVHRDLKLENVMVGPDGHVVLTDFGIAHVGSAKDGGSTVVDPVNTILAIRDGKKPVMGSLGYMAPELEMGCAATPASDWYALGVIVYRLLTGTWCDARTNVAETLESFDPAWMTIVPQLLHSNPSARACPSFAETRRALRESEAAAAEDRYLKEKLRGHIARHVARWAGGGCLVLAAVLLYGGLAIRSERRLARLQLQQAQTGMRCDVPTFDELFGIPAAAKAEETTDADGNVTMPSRSQFGASRVDALVLTQPTLSALSAGLVTPEKAIADFERMAEGLEEDADRSPLDGLEFGGNAYMQMGDNESLRRLLLQAVEKLRARSGLE